MSTETKITWDFKDIDSKLSSLLDDTTRMKIQETFAEIIDPWTPYLTGKLHRTYAVDPDSVTYLVDYASKKYYGEVYTKTYHPLATSHWDTVAMQTELPTLEQKVKEILKERAKEIYG